MREALRNWRLASEDAKLAIEVFRSNGQDQERLKALRTAMARQSEALQRCVETVEALARANRTR